MNDSIANDSTTNENITNENITNENITNKNITNNAAQDLGWTSDSYLANTGAVMEQLARFVEASQNNTLDAANWRSLPELLDTFNASHWFKEGGLQAESLTAFMADFLSHATRLHHPAYIAHQVATPAVPSAIADLVHGSINNPYAVYEMGPSAAALEFASINWMLDKIGWTPESVKTPTAPGAGGVLTHGGSLANLTALLAARSAVVADAWENGNPDNLVILVPQSSHYSIARTVSIMGLGKKRMIEIPCDALGRVLPSALEETIAKTKANQQQIMAVIANACATATGLFDDLDTIGAICEAAGLWLHVDACHGGPYLASAKQKHLLHGIDKAHSVSWDAHKMMRVSSLCAAVLVRDKRHLDNAFQQQANYLFYGDDSGGIDYSHRTLECTKAGLGTKLFLTLAWAGEQGIARYIDAQSQKAQDFYRMLLSSPDFTCPYAPESNIICFRYQDDDDQQIRIKEQLLKEGSFHIGSSTIGALRYLRLSIMSPDTNTATLSALIERIRQIG